MDALHLTTAHKSTDTRIFEKEARSLVEFGFEVGIVAHDPPAESKSGVKFYDLGTTESRVQRWKSIRKIAQIAKRSDADIYHFHDLELLPVGVYLSQKTDAAVVYDVHEDFGHLASMRDWIPKPLRPVLATTIPTFERICVRQLDAVVAVSDWIGEQFVGCIDQIRTVHNFPQTESMPDKDASIESNSDCVLCYVGGLIDVRGIHRMLEVLNHLVECGVDAELWALGSWMPDADRERAQEYIRNNDLKSRVRFPGYVSRKEMFRYLFSADIGLALLDTEHYTHGIPTKVFEYLYAGLPVVITPIDAVGPYLPEEYTSVVPQGDTEAAATAVKQAMARPHDGAAMRSLVEEKYSWENEAEKLEELYRSLLS